MKDDKISGKAAGKCSSKPAPAPKKKQVANKKKVYVDISKLTAPVHPHHKTSTSSAMNDDVLIWIHRHVDMLRVREEREQCLLLFEGGTGDAVTKIGVLASSSSSTSSRKNRKRKTPDAMTEVRVYYVTHICSPS